MKKFTHLEIVKKLIGKTSPTGESNTDQERLENLKEICKLTEDLIDHIKKTSTSNSDQQYSVQRIRVYAFDFLNKIKYNLEEDFK